MFIRMNETAAESLCISSSKNESDGVDDDEDVRISELRKISYGFIMPTICLLGIVGNVLNLVVLTRRNMQGRAYIYMRAYSTASLVAISFCIPFALRVLIAKEKGGWTSWFQAFYHVHLELYLGNSCLGRVCVMTLLALTVERHASVCRLRPTSNLAASGATFQRGLSPRSTILLLAVGTFFLYLPTIFRAEMSSCISARLNHQRLYQQHDNRLLLQSAFYQVYQVMLELVFKIGPTLLLAGLNLRIMLVYRRACNKRRRRRQSGAGYMAEERRLMLLLGSTSLLFLVCVSPMVFLNLTLSQDNLAHFAYQVFRALANLLEVTNYSLTFYIYCLFSEDFRNTLRRTFTAASSVNSSTQQQQRTPSPIS